MNRHRELLNPGLLGRVMLVALVTLTTTACLMSAQVPRVEGSFDRTLSTTGPVTLAIKTGSGDIQVKAGTDAAVHVIGRIRAGGGFMWTLNISPEEQVKILEADPPIEQRGNVISIGNLKDTTVGRNVRISYEVTVPANTSVHSETGSGDQLVDSLQGSLDARTGSGDLRVGRIGAHVILSTGSGDVDVAGAASGLDVTTGSGDVVASGVGGSVAARTGSGDLRLVQTATGDVDAVTGSGSISVSGVRGGAHIRAGSGDVIVEGTPVKDWSVATASGSVTLRVPADTGFVLDAQSPSGSIATSHSIDGAASISQHRMQGRANGGGPRLDVSTGSGGIRIE